MADLFNSGLGNITAGGGYGPSVTIGIPQGTFGQSQPEQSGGGSIFGNAASGTLNDLTFGIFGSKSQAQQSLIPGPFDLGKSAVSGVSGFFGDYGLRIILVILGLILIAFGAWAFISKNTSVSLNLGAK